MKPPMLVLALIAALMAAPVLADPVSPDTVSVDRHGAGRAFPHYWEAMFGSGRAVLSLRAQYREDLAAMKATTDLHYVRFHAILHDENGVYDEDEAGRPVFNFSQIDQIYDGLLAKGVRPVVEIGFMPQKLAAYPAPHPFWYHPNMAPPKDYAKWDALIQAFAQHLIDRYGMAEVSRWYFEVWNEPNIDFWAGEPKQETYFTLYAHTARALKSVNPGLRVGGPATSSAHWVPEFLDRMAKDGVPVDFVSTHGYADDTVADLFGAQAAVLGDIAPEQRLCRAVRKVHDQIAASPRPGLPLLWTEWNVPGYGEARDTSYIGAALADDIVQCDGLATMMSLWTFSAVFEEGGPDTSPFHGQFGLIGPGGIRKPGFTAFAMLHRLGTTRLATTGNEVLATRRADGSLAIALWNLMPPTAPAHHRSVVLHLGSGAPVRLTLLDDTHGNSLTAWKAMGSPRYPTQTRIAELNRAAIPATRTLHPTRDGTITLDLSPNALALIETARSR